MSKSWKDSKKTRKNNSKEAKENSMIDSKKKIKEFHN